MENATAIGELVSIVFGLISICLLVPALVICIQSLTAVFFPDAANRSGRYKKKKIKKTIIIPAHNEEQTIASTLKGLSMQLDEMTHIVVVADNCGDATAAIAASHGVEVIERQDRENRGKGFALDYAINYLKQDPPNVVLILDADCGLSEGAVDGLSQVAVNTGRPAQAYYQMKNEEGVTRPGQEVSAFAWLMRGFVRPLGMAGMNMPCQLYGTGMAFPWEVISKQKLASGDIVEDMKLTVDLIDQGVMPLFCADWKVSSFFPVTENATYDQRKRWEHGHIATIIKHGIPAVIRSLVSMSMQRLMLALDVCVPPLSLYVTILMLGLLAGVALTLLLGIGGYGLVVVALSWLLLLSGLSTAWFRLGRDVLQLSTVLGIPRYVLSKFSIYKKYVTDRQKDWNRTDRG
ncbi:MAG: glycosyltransferase family 2 protein [Candidatus Sedimenticola sp. (ex Thyasira tokunagai)]